MVSLSLGQIAEQAGVRPPGSSSNSRRRQVSNNNHNEVATPGAAAGIASGTATANVPKILEPAPVSGSASSGSTVSGLASGHAPAPALAAERSASATDLYQRAIRDAELGGEHHQQHGSDPVRPITRSTSTPPDERSSEPVPQQQQQQERRDTARQQAQTQDHHLHPPQHGHPSSVQAASHPYQQDGAAARQSNSNSAQGSDTSPNSDPSPGSHASTSIIPEHHRVYTASYLPTAAGPYGHAIHSPGSAGHFSASSSPSYIQHHPQQNPTYAYHTQYYAPQYHYPPPNDGQQPYYAVATATSPHSPVQDPQAGMAPQTFFPQTYYYSTGQVLHTAASSPNSAAALVLDDGTLSHHALSDDMSNGHHGRPFSAQSMHQNMQPPMQQLHQQQQHPQHRQQRLPAGMTYQLSPQTGVPTYVAYTTSHGPGNHRMMGNSHAPNEYHTIHNPPMSPVLAHGFTYSQAGSQRGSVDMGQQYRHVQFTPMSPQSFASPVLGRQHLRYSTVDSAFSTSSPYTSTDHAAAPPAYTPQASRLSTNAQSPPQPTELARGHLAQSKFREALGAYDPNARLPISASERRRAAASEARLPKPPAHSPWAMWVGNVPSDATHSELWRFFVSRPPPGPPIPGSKEEEDTLEAEAEYPPGPDQPPPDYNTVGIESVHLISRSNCCFVNMASKRHLDHAIKVSHGLSLRPHDPRCKPLVCRVRKKDDDNKTGVGAQRGKGMHQAWAAEKEKDRRLADAEVEVSNIIAKDAAAPLSPPAESDIHGTRNGSASTVHSGSTSSTTSSFLQRHFPRRYFILKSHAEDDLHLSVERGLWATQSHNEPVLDQAYRTAQNVFLVFGANKSGEFFGYAKMAGPILKPQERRSNRSLGPDGDASTSSAGKSSASIGRKPEPSIPETPEDETTEVVQPPGRLSVPPPVSVLSPSGVVSNSPQPISTLTTPAQTKSADANLDYLNVKSSQHYTAPSPSICEKTSLDARKAGSLDPSVLANLAKMEIKERANELENKGISPNGAAVASKALNDQMMAGASSRPGLNDVDGVFRRDTMLSPSERNARLELLESEAADGHARSGSSGDKSLKDAMEQGISKPFKIEWIRVQKLPFYRTRHLRNAFNGNREVKISRDGTEIEPDVGQQLLELFWKDPALSTSQQTSPLHNSASMTSPLVA